jgi:hypothetical protein
MNQELTAEVSNSNNFEIYFKGEILRLNVRELIELLSDVSFT